MLRKFAIFKDSDGEHLVAIRADIIKTVSFDEDDGKIWVEYDDGSPEGGACFSIANTVQEAVKEIETCLA